MPKRLRIEKPSKPRMPALEGSLNSAGHRFGIVVSRFNAFITERLLQSTIDALRRTGAKDKDILIVRVPGSFEIPSASRALAETACWLGRFHARQEARVTEPALSFLKRYEAEYYRAWARRMFEFSRPLRKDFPWLARLQRSGDRWFAPLLDSPPTVVHGEFYAKTVLVRRGRLFMVDWESAAIGAGEIDLAALTEGKHWRGHIAHKCEQQYQRARWPRGVPADFKRTLDSARIYLHFRWLGERPDWTTRGKTLWRYDHLRATAERRGLI